LLKLSVSLQIALAAETHLADGLTLKLWLTMKEEKSLIILLGILKLTVSNKEEQLIVFLNTYSNNNNNNNNNLIIIILYDYDNVLNSESYNFETPRM
jgi:hypothetical protein